MIVWCDCDYAKHLFTISCNFVLQIVVNMMKKMKIALVAFAPGLPAEVQANAPARSHVRLLEKLLMEIEHKDKPFLHVKNLLNQLVRLRNLSL